MGYEESRIEGRNAVLEAFRSGKTIDKLYVLDGCQDGPVKSITREARKHDTIIQGEVQPDRAVRPGVAVLPGNAGSVQQQRVEHLCVVADVPQGFVLEKKPWERYIVCRRALRREPCKKFSSALLYHPSIHFVLID